MKKYNIIQWVMCAIGLACMTGCKNDTQMEISASGSCIISQISLNKLQRFVHVVSSKGNDSVYSIVFEGNAYPLSIDQLNNRIFNKDSLPYGVNLKKTLLNKITASAGGYSIKSIYSGKDTILSEKDTLDCSVPRYITVYASDGRSKRIYRLQLNAHRQDGNKFEWEKPASANAVLASAKPGKAFIANHFLVMYGRQDGKVFRYSASLDNLSDWQKEAVNNQNLDESSPLFFKGNYYALDNNHRLMMSQDGTQWKNAPSEMMADKLLFSNDREMAVLSGKAIYASMDGATWRKDSLQTTGDLPFENVNLASAFFSASDNEEGGEELLISCGPRQLLWKKRASGKASRYPWIYYPTRENDSAGELLNPSLYDYDGYALLLGTSPKGGLADILISKDMGLTWNRTIIQRPKDMKNCSSVATAVDDQHYVYVLCAGSGDVWRGRLTRLGWRKH